MATPPNTGYQRDLSDTGQERQEKRKEPSASAEVFRGQNIMPWRGPGGQFFFLGNLVFRLFPGPEW